MKQYRSFHGVAVCAVLIMCSGCATFGLASGDASNKEVPPRGDSQQVSNASSVAESDEEASTTFALENAEVTTADFQFESHGETLRGELVMPVASEMERPGVVIVHDSGPLSRDGIMRSSFGVGLPVEIAVYRSLAEHLASRGFVVLIWDKRTCLAGSQPWCSYPREYIDGHRDTLGEVLVADVRSAARALRADSRTSNTLHLVGHGHGAELVLAAAEADADTLVLASPNTQPLDQMILTQIERSVEALTSRVDAASDAETDLMVEQLASLSDRLEKLKTSFSEIRAGKGAETAGLSAAAWRSLFGVHDAAASAEFAKPMLVIHAGLDLDVDEESRGDMMAKWEGQGARVVQFDELTRPLVDVSETADPTTVSDSVLQTLSDFLISESAQ